MKEIPKTSLTYIIDEMIFHIETPTILQPTKESSVAVK
jgi:hypothetical protein